MYNPGEQETSALSWMVVEKALVFQGFYETIKGADGNQTRTSGASWARGMRTLKKKKKNYLYLKDREQQRYMFLLSQRRRQNVRTES